MSEDESAEFDVFMSHASAVKQTVLTLAAGLREVGLKPWVDVEQMGPGASVGQSISIGIANSRCCAVFVAAQDPEGWVLAELEAATSRSVRDPDFRVFLVLLPGVGESFDHSRIPGLPSWRVWVDLRREDHEGAIDILARGVRGEPARPIAEPPQPLAEIECPYVGYRPFDVSDAHLFHGRDGDIQKMIESLRREDFLAVVGNSGSGKSSVVRAGLIPALSMGTLAGEFEEIVLLAPGKDPLQSLLMELARLRPDRQITSIRDDLMDDYGTLGVLGGKQVCWVVDQFEEVFTQAEPSPETTAFVENLIRASLPGGGATVVMVVRSDFVGKTTAYPSLSDRVASHQYIVQDLGEEALREAIIGPAAQVNAKFEAGLPERIIADGASEPGMLPLLQYTLRELWESSGGQLTHTAYDDIGGVQGSLARQTETILLRFDEEQHVLARSLLTSMVSLGEGMRDTKRSIPLDEARTLGDAEVVEQIIGEFTRARLIRAGADSLELTHDSLLETWPQLRDWVDEARDDIRTRDSLARSASDWTDAVELGAPGQSYLLSGHRLESALDWQSDQFAVEQEIEDYLAASEAANQARIDAEEERTAAAVRRRRNTIVGLSVLSVALLVIAGYAFIQSNLADERTSEAEALALQAESRALADTNPALATMMALESGEWSDVAVGGQSDALGIAVGAFADAKPLPLPLLSGHAAVVRSVSFSPDGGLLASCDDAGVVNLWDSTAGTLERTIAGPPEGVWWTTFSPDGRVLVGAGSDGSIRLWETQTGEARPFLRSHDGKVLGVAFSPTSGLLASAGDDGRVRIWDTATGELERTLGGHGQAVWALAFAADGRTMATASLDETIRLWNTSTWETTMVLEGHEGFVFSVAFSSDGGLLASSGVDRTVRLWSTRNGSELVSLEGHEGPALGVAFSFDDRLLGSVGDDRTVRIWDVEQQALITTLQGTGSMRAVAFLPGENFLAAAGSDGSVSRWISGQHVIPVLDGHSGGVRSVSFSSDGGQMATGGADGTVQLWDSRTGEQKAVLTGHTDSVWSVSFSPDGTTLASAGDDKTVRLWDAETGRGKAILEGHAAGLRSVTFSPNGATVASASIDQTVRLWDTASGELMAIYEDHESEVSAVAFSEDGHFASAGLDGTVQVRSPEEGSISVLDAAAGPVYTIAFSPTGEMLASAGEDAKLRLWNLDDGQLIAMLEGHTDAIWAVEFSPDGQLVASGGLHRSVRVWDIDNLRMTATFRLHTGPTRDVAFSADGERLASVSEDGTGRLVPTPSSEVLCPLLAPYLTGQIVLDRLPVESRPVVCADLWAESDPG